MKLFKTGLVIVIFKLLALPAHAAVADFNSLIEASSIEEVETQIRILEGQPDRSQAMSRAQQKVQDLMLTGSDKDAVVIARSEPQIEITLATGK